MRRKLDLQEQELNFKQKEADGKKWSTGEKAMAGAGVMAGAGALLAGGAVLGGAAVLGYQALTKKKDGKDDDDSDEENTDLVGKVKAMINNTNSKKKSELVNDDVASAEIERLQKIKKRDKERKRKAANAEDLDEEEK